MSLLKIENLQVHYPIGNHILKAVDGVSLEVGRGETLGLVGESGCGKSTLARAILQLLKPTGGRIVFDSVDLSTLRGKKLRKMRRRIQMVFQDPIGSLNPHWTVSHALEEGILIHGLEESREQRRRRVTEWLERVGLKKEHGDRYPHEFSGGQRQRIGIARALSVEPDLVVCDEPVSALDVSVQAQVLNLLKDLQQQTGVSYLFIAHDLGVVEHMSQRMAVMYGGRLMELGPARDLVQRPCHPYTKTLIAAAGDSQTWGQGKETKELPVPIPERESNPPSTRGGRQGCPFYDRCPVAEDLCEQQRPEWREIRKGRWVACHLS